MDRRRIGGWLMAAALVIFAALALPPVRLSVQAPASRPSESSLDIDLAKVPPVDEAKAAACAETVTEFVSALDEVMSQRPESILGYDAVLARHLFLRNGTPGLPPPKPGASIEGCDIKRIIEIAKRSRFFHKVGRASVGSPIVEFRNKSAKVSFALDILTGDIVGPVADWITVYP